MTFCLLNWLKSQTENSFPENPWYAVWVDHNWQSRLVGLDTRMINVRLFCNWLPAVVASFECYLKRTYFSEEQKSCPLYWTIKWKIVFFWKLPKNLIIASEHNSILTRANFGEFFVSIRQIHQDKFWPKMSSRLLW